MELLCVVFVCLFVSISSGAIGLRNGTWSRGIN